MLNHLVSGNKKITYQMIFFFVCSISQVHPTSIMTFITCGLSVKTITITPTIPARLNKRGWPKISFWLPLEIQLVNRDDCEIQLEGIKPITLQIKATCPDTGATEGLKALLPQISNKHSHWFWNNHPEFPTVWVCRRLTRVVFMKSINREQ